MSAAESMVQRGHQAMADAAARMRISEPGTPEKAPPHDDRRSVEKAINAAIKECDPETLLRPHHVLEIVEAISHHILHVLEEENRTDIGDDGRAFIEWRTGQCVCMCFEQYAAERKQQPTRFLKMERVLIRIDADTNSWASGSIEKLNEDNPDDLRGPTFPYVVRLDAPDSRLLPVKADDSTQCRAEVCFGQRADGFLSTLSSMPPIPRGKASVRRFKAGERVAVAVEDATDKYSDWVAGTVVDVDYSVAEKAATLLPSRDWSGNKGVVPYRVELDSGGSVLVHKDEHWLLRDLELQTAGPRQCEDGRCLSRLIKRHKGDYTFEAIDHGTRRVRPCEPPEDDTFCHSGDANCPCQPGG